MFQPHGSCFSLMAHVGTPNYQFDPELLLEFNPRFRYPVSFVHVLRAGLRSLSCGEQGAVGEGVLGVPTRRSI